MYSLSSLMSPEELQAHFINSNWPQNISNCCCDLICVSSQGEILRSMQLNAINISVLHSVQKNNEIQRGSVLILIDSCYFYCRQRNALHVFMAEHFVSPIVTIDWIVYFYSLWSEWFTLHFIFSSVVCVFYDSFTKISTQNVTKKSLETNAVDRLYILNCV